LKKYDWVVIGAGIYGLYSAKILSEKGLSVCVLEYEDAPFKRGSYINQARVHLGYHYPRSYSTAIKSSSYFKRFCDEFAPAINSDFLKIYSISRDFSFTSGDQFMKFCLAANIPCKSVDTSEYYNPNTIDKSFETLEYSFDAGVIKNILIDNIKKAGNTDIFYNSQICSAKTEGDQYLIKLKSGLEIATNGVINATYASTNQINHLFGFEKFKIKYEICEMILCSVSDNIKKVGLTVMDGPFFSVMPFGLSGLHSVSSVTFTPHIVSYDDLPTFNCQKLNKLCTPMQLANCNECPAKPKTAWPQMSQIAKKYLKPEIKIEYKDSLFAIKPIALASEIDDSRPTIIKVLSDKPKFITILSGKINTMYDLEGVL